MLKIDEDKKLNAMKTMNCKRKQKNNQIKKKKCN